jgi:hypothetical protein
MSVISDQYCIHPKSTILSPPPIEIELFTMDIVVSAGLDDI